MIGRIIAHCLKSVHVNELVKRFGVYNRGMVAHKYKCTCFTEFITHEIFYKSMKNTVNKY